MIVKAAVIVYDKRQKKNIIIPCMRHCDAFFILKQFGYENTIDYEEISQGFLDEQDNYHTRFDACKHAIACGQISPRPVHDLYSEDLW